MPRLKQLKVGVDAFTEARLIVRAEQAAASVSEYVRALIVRELDASGDSTASVLAVRPADPLTPELLELAVVTGILVRAQLAHLVGEDQARQLQTRAQERAAEHLRTLLGSRTETVA